MSNENLYQERAENLTREDLKNWITLTEQDKKIIKQLKNNSTRLLVGSRGSGKSMLMKWAYYSCLDDNDMIFPIYVNFEKYLFLEPLLYKTSNGNVLFGRWVLAKLLLGCRETMSEILLSDKFDLLLEGFFNISFNELQHLVYTLEGGNYNNLLFETGNDLTGGKILNFIENILLETGYKRSIILMDDAAHAFSSNLQKQFFEIFRILKSRMIASKAAVYPGVTSYSPYFNVGHDAQFLQVCYFPDEDGYTRFCDELLNKRLGQDNYAKLARNEQGLKTIYYAANGIPRGLIVMSEFLLEGAQPTYKKYYAAIDYWMDVIDKFHVSLKYRLPRYRRFIDSGTELMGICTEYLKEYNKKKPTSQKGIYLGFSEDPIPSELQKTIDILEYAGLLTERPHIKKGEKGSFKRYLVNLGKIIQSHALAEGTTKTFKYTCESFEKAKARSFKRVNSKKLYEDRFEGSLMLELPPCPKCGKDRISEDALFCAYCGAELKSVSIFYELLNKDIDCLPLTQHRIQIIKNGCKIRTIKDVIMDENGVELKKVKGIKGGWAKKIYTYAEEFIGG